MNEMTLACCPKDKNNYAWQLEIWTKRGLDNISVDILSLFDSK